MNIVQLHERVRFWIDSVASTRFEVSDINNAINIAIESKILETYDQVRPMNRSDSFQRTQRCRDILGPVVKKATQSTSGFTISDNQISIAATTDYNILLSLTVTLGSQQIECIPQTYDRKNKAWRNPFRVKRMTPSPLVYYIEVDGGIEILHAHTADPTVFELYYLKKPRLVSWGTEYLTGHDFTIGNVVYAVENTVYNGSSYVPGDEITIVAGHLQITSGNVIFGYTDCELRSLVHEEISRRAAINCLMIAGQSDKAKLLREEITAA